VWMLFHLYLVLSPEKKVIMQYLLNIFILVTEQL
jgi:hypothetical protein